MTDESLQPAEPLPVARELHIARELRDIHTQLALLAARVTRTESRLGINVEAAGFPTQAASAEISVPPTTTPVTPPKVLPPIPSPAAESHPTPGSPPTPSPPAVPVPAAIPATEPPRPTFQSHPPREAFAATPSTPAASAPVPGPRPPDRVLPHPVEPAHSPSMIGDWENLIGGKWALWMGVFSLFLAVASFLAYTWKSLPPPPPSVRVALGLAAGATLIGAGGFFRARTQRWFSEGLAGAGLAVLYLSIWAGAQHFHLLSFGAAFTAMAFTTILGVYLALRFDALSLSVLATLGGFLTPLLLHGSTASGGHALSLLTYVAVLNAGILAVSLFKRWSALTWLSFLATLLLISLWIGDDYTVAQRWPTLAYFTVYFLLFLGASCFGSLVRREQTAQDDLLLLFGSTSVYALAGYGVLNGGLGSVPGTFALALMLFFAFLSHTARTLAPENFRLRQSTAGLSLLFLTVTVPIQLKQQGLAIGWCMEAGILLILGLRLRAALLQRAGQVVWCLSLLPLLGVLLDTPSTPHIVFVNERALPLLISVLMSALVVLQDWQIRTADAKPMLRDELAPTYASYATLAGAWLLAQETYLWFSWHRLPSAGTWHAGALCVIAMFLACYAAIVFACGLRLRDVSIRISATAVMAVAMAIPVWSNSAFSTTGWTPFWNLRWLSYVVVALSLAAMGWMLSREDAAVSTAETENLSLFPAAVSLFALMGMTIEVYGGFEQWALPSRGDWQTGALCAIVMLWSVFAAFLIYLSHSWHQTALRGVAITTGGLGSLLLLFVSVGSSALGWTPLFNLRALAFAVAVAMLALMAMIESRRVGGSTAVGISLLSICLLLWGLTQETYGMCRHFHSALGPDWRLVAFFAISVLWNTGVFVMLSSGLRRGTLPFRVAAYGLSTLSCALLLWTALDATRLGWTPFLNARWVAFVIAEFLLGGGSALLNKYRAQLTNWEQEGAASLGWAAGTLCLWGLTQETHELCFYYRQVLGAHWDRWAQMAISFVWSGYGAALLIGGINRSFQPVRLVALALLAATVLKVFLFDLSFLDGPLRMLSLAGLGLALIFISWLYGRFGNAKGSINSKTSMATQDKTSDSKEVTA